MNARPDPGLCGGCAHARTVGNRRGSTFTRCGRSDADPRFPRYPRLPVLACDGYRRVGAPRVGDPSSGEGDAPPPRG